MLRLPLFDLSMIICFTMEGLYPILIITKMQSHLQEQQLIKQFESLLYPSYPIGCTAEVFLKQHQQLLQSLHRFDTSTELHNLQKLPLHLLQKIQPHLQTEKESQIIDHFVMIIIKLLNESCSRCHRKEYSDQIFKELSLFRGHLKNLAIGKEPIRISWWSIALQTQNPTELYYQIKQPAVLSLCDTLYQDLHFIPHRETFLLNYTHVLLGLNRVKEALRGAQNALPITHQLYLGVIASATYGAKYQWNRSVSAFLQSGGQPSWISQGSKALPACLKQMSKFSPLMAYNSKQFNQQDLFSCPNSNKNRFISLVWLAYYQSLACLDLVCGFIPESTQYLLKYLPDHPTVRPSLGSFQAIKMTEGIQSIHELRAAQQFTSIYNWERDSDEDIKVKIEGAKSIEIGKPTKVKKMKGITSLPQMKETQFNQIYLLGRVEEDQIIDKLRNLQTLRYLRSVFQKYVQFQCLAQSFTKKQRQPLRQDNLVLASDWDFQIKGLNRIQLLLGSKTRHAVHNLLSVMRVQQTQKSKQLKHYYQFFNNYMYEYQSYTKLIKEISINQKNYLKLITKSPFLFTQQAFMRMKNDLGKLGIDCLDFIIQAISYKFELSINLLTYLYDRETQQQP